MEDFGGEVLEADEDAVVSEVVVGGVVEFGRLGEEGRAGVAVDADEDRVGFGGVVGGDAGHEVAANLEGRGFPGDGFFNVGEGQAGFPDGFEGDHGVRVQGLAGGRRSGMKGQHLNGHTTNAILGDDSGNRHGGIKKS